MRAQRGRATTHREGDQSSLTQTAAKPSAEEQEVRGLITLFNASRESPVPIGVYVKYQQSLENIAKAEQVASRAEFSMPFCPQIRLHMISSRRFTHTKFIQIIGLQNI